MDGSPVETGTLILNQLARYGRYLRLKRVCPWWAVAGIVFALTAYWYPIDPLLSTVGLVPVIYVLAPLPLAWTARQLHKVDGPEPDVLCAVEHLGSEGGIVEAQRQRVQARLQSINAETRLGTTLIWIFILPAWFLPWGYSVRVDRGLEANQVASGVEEPRRLTTNRDPVSTQRKEQRQTRKDSRRSEIGEKTPRKVTGAKGRASSDKGRGAASTTRAAVSVDKSAAEVPFMGAGNGGDTRGGKLTEASKNGKLKLLVKDRLDPSEKYPVEYREAIRKWFQKRK